MCPNHPTYLYLSQITDVYENFTRESALKLCLEQVYMELQYCFTQLENVGRPNNAFVAAFLGIFSLSSTATKMSVLVANYTSSMFALQFPGLYLRDVLR